MSNNFEANMTPRMRQKPMMSFVSIVNMAFGFFGLQIGFALQNANSSRVFQSLGANVDELALFWLAAPMTGLIVQPIIGYLSDRTWGRFGRRRPYFFVGALLASVTLIFMPNSAYLWVAVGSLWILDASLNISMEPFRAFVGDNLNSRQRTLGYAMQGFFIGIGGYVASKLPNYLTAAGVSNTAAANDVPDSVKLAFLIGGILLFGSVLWTILTTKEYTPKELQGFEAAETSEVALMRQRPQAVPEAAFFTKWGAIISGLGAALIALVFAANTDKQFSIFAGLVLVTGVLFLMNSFFIKSGQTDNMLSGVLGDLVTMPTLMKWLAAVQFTSWFAFFIMWIYTTPAVAAYHFGAVEAGSEAYGQGSLAVNNLFALYNLVPILFSLILPLITRLIGLKLTYALALICGGLGLISIYFGGPSTFWLSAIGIGVAWASILILPYSILADALPAERMGTYMGIFNFFIVIPQIVVGTVMGAIVKNVFGGDAIYALLIGGGVMMLGAIILFFLPYKQPVKQT
jgi:maltose/moltooligosaccharide transporter